jgi:hypothetical protein
MRRSDQPASQDLVRLLIMSRESKLPSIAGVILGSAAVGGVIWFLLKHSKIDFVAAATSVTVLALLVGVATSRPAGVAVFAAGITLLVNDALLAARFATLLGFGHLSLADSIGLWPASALLVLAIATAYLITVMPFRRWLVLVAVVLTVLVSWPAKLSSQFFL